MCDGESWPSASTMPIDGNHETLHEAYSPSIRGPCYLRLKRWHSYRSLMQSSIFRTRRQDARIVLSLVILRLYFLNFFY